MVWSATPDVGWTIVEPETELDPDQYLGEFGELPHEDGEPGKWCDVVVRDTLGEMRWTFMLVRGRSQCVTSGTRQPNGSRSLNASQSLRRRGIRALREWEREDEAAAASSAPFCLRAAAGTDGNRAGRRLRLIRNIDFA